MKFASLTRLIVTVLALCQAADTAYAQQSVAEKAGFTVTPAMQSAMNNSGPETPTAWLGRAIKFDYQLNPMDVEDGRHHLTAARNSCAAGDKDSCATARQIEGWLSWARLNAPHASYLCATPCVRVPDKFIPPTVKGKLFVLHVWASWCPYCRSDHLRLIDITHKGHLRLVSLVYQDTQAAANDFLADHGNPYSDGSILVSRELLNALDIRSYPITFVISPEGNILQRFQGELGDEGQSSLENYLNN